MTTLNSAPVRFLLQAINYTVFMAIIWYFSTAPAVRLIGENDSLITIAFAHAGELREPCYKLSQAELMKLAPNMRKPEDCPRERSPITVEARLDGELIYQKTMQPPGLFKDGSVDIYFSKKIPAGEHRFEIKMDDSVRKPGFDYALEQEIEVSPAQILLIEFEPLKGFFVKG